MDLVALLSDPALVAAVGLLGGLAANRRGREGWAFVGTAVCIAFLFATVFWALFPAYVSVVFLPVVGIFAAFPRWLIAGLTSGGVKG